MERKDVDHTVLSRRNFLVGAAAGTAGLAAASLIGGCSSPQSSSDDEAPQDEGAAIPTNSPTASI